MKINELVKEEYFKQTISDRGLRTACGVYSYSWVVQSYGLFPSGLVEWSTRWEEVKNTVIRALDCSKEIMHG